MMATPKSEVDARISSARARLASNISQLQERMTRARDTFSPSAYLKSPWLTVGAGIAIGLLVGRRRAPLRLTAGDATPTAPSTGLLRTAVMATVTSLARVMIEKLVTDLNAKHDDSVDDSE
jgi:hypothetical protein